jgi:hypothetical protein
MSTKSMVVGALAVGVVGAAIFSFTGGPPILSSDGAMVGVKVVAAAVVGGYVASWAGGQFNY